MTKEFCLCADAPRREIYFLAVIDVLTHYGMKKQAAKAAKTVKYGSNVEGMSASLPSHTHEAITNNYLLRLQGSLPVSPISMPKDLLSSSQEQLNSRT